MIARAALAGAFALATVASCSRDVTLPATGIDGGLPQPACPPASGRSMPRALIGPDATFHITCGGRASSPIASVDEEGPGVTSWSISLTGDPSFTPESPALQTCLGNSPQVAFVAFYPPVSAVPGDTFDGVATVHADDGSFADGTVALHGEVVSPMVTVSTTTIDFGDVAPGDAPGRLLEFRALEGGHVSINHESLAGSPFSVMNTEFSVATTVPDVTRWRVAFQSSVPGDYTASVVWRGVPLGRANPAPEACVWATAVTMHARVLADAGASDGGSSDGGSSDDAAVAP
jgi:hypothetical protein